MFSKKDSTLYAVAVLYLSNTPRLSTFDNPLCKDAGKTSSLSRVLLGQSSQHTEETTNRTKKKICCRPAYE